jgi:hypothetical protein
MRVHPVLKFGSVFLLLRLFVGIFYVIVQASSPGEGAMILLTDVPALALGFLWSAIFRFPDAFVDAYDPIFHAFGGLAWFLIGASIGFFAAKRKARGIDQVG